MNTHTVSELLADPWTDVEVVYDGPLDVTVESLQDAIASGKLLNLRGDPLSLDTPGVTLGRPICWNLARLAAAKGIELPAEMRLLLDRSDFFLVRLACSFRLGFRSKVVWTRLNASLAGPYKSLRPRVFDIFPKQVSQETKASREVGISPTLTFAEIASVSLGKWVTTFEYNAQTPIVAGSGILEETASWEFMPRDLQPIQGSWTLHLIVERPKPVESVDMHLAVGAVIETRGGLLLASLDRLHRDGLHFEICTE